MPDNHLTIIGAGPAGLAAGFYSRRHSLPFTIYEAGAQVGGNARTLTYGDFRFDTGAHRFHSQDEVATRDLLALMGDRLREINVPSQIVYQGRFIDFPLSPLNLFLRFGAGNLLRAGASFVLARTSGGRSSESFEQAVVGRYGRRISEAFLLGYTEKLWGVPPGRLSPRVSGRRLQGLNLRTFIVEAFGGMRAKTEHLDGRFYYPVGGIGDIMEVFADAAGRDRIRLESRITRITHANNLITGIEINQHEQLPVSNLLSTLPLSVLLRGLDPSPPQEIMALLERIQFRHVVLVALFLDRARVTTNASLYFPDRGVPFTRVYEPKNRSAAMAPKHQTSLIVEIPASTDDPAWQADDSELIWQCSAHLTDAGLFAASELLDGSVHRIRFAYPILEIGFETIVESLLDYLRAFGNLQIIGRNGAFAYTHIHDLMRDGRLAIEEYEALR